MKILLCTNGKRHVEGAITFSLDLFKPMRPQVTLLYVCSEAEPDGTGEQVLAAGRRAIHTFHPELDVQTKTLTGNVANHILMESRVGDYDLVVMGSKGPSESLVGVSELIISEVVDEVIRSCPISVFVVKEPHPVSRVLLCTDGSAAAERAISFWARLHKSQEPRVVALHVAPQIYAHHQDFIGALSDQHLEILQGLPSQMTDPLHRARALLKLDGIEVRVQLRGGEVAEEILRESERAYDLIVMGFRGLKELTRPTLGSQTVKVMQRSRVPVLAWKG